MAFDHAIVCLGGGGGWGGVEHSLYCPTQGGPAHLFQYMKGQGIH